MNEVGQPVGFELPGWKACPRPEKTAHEGLYCRLERVKPEEHAKELYDAFILSDQGQNWTYLISEPFGDFDQFKSWLEEVADRADPFFYVVVDRRSNKAVGMASYLRISPEQGSIEVGHIHFSPLMQRTPVSTEAMFLMMQYAFDELGYRRYEWKCDSLNQPSRNAALRLGFTFEGIFRQAMVYKNRNRDTAWFSILDKEWSEQKRRFQAWLKEENFDEEGVQVKRLNDC